ncbi:DNA polymerase/3'-5' exonuclease PolX [Anaerohalosphaera lusitana]|uniref:DNA polymerase beta n=1 Tax=Anaerohalosphaera lusitana TaxID=1936003 RepID=A0A1U9NQW6_9BACT|nr:DNA polymerase/3'-5' exonuclease PolX [Anaerohalosphaera lusitana]AQT70134.1 DNA polymerase/3'-5' exonuclease PolX [Anaerohalosphaera lusitana]
MPINNDDIADVLTELADLLEIQGANTFRVRAYRNAARTVSSLSEDVGGYISSGKDLSDLPGIGKDLAGKIEQILGTGSLPMLEDLKKEVPEDLSRLLDVGGLGPKRVATMYKELGVESLDDLEKAAKDGKIRDLEGFGKKTEESILEGIQRVKQQKRGRIRLDKADRIAEPLLEYLRKNDDIKSLDVAGSYRRRKETVRDIDILATCKKGTDVMKYFSDYEDVEKVVAEGETKSSVLLRSGIQVDLRVMPQVSFGAAMVYFTGSKEHNIALRKIAIRKKWKVNEYGIFKGDDRLAGKTEEEIYDRLGMAYVPPELREDRGEIEAAQKDKLPDILQQDDIRGDLHCHSKYTDGHNTIEEMAKAAKDLGYDYMAMTDHSKRVTVAHGLKPEDVERQIAEIDKLNKKLKDFTILKGTEVDILKDGSLDLPDETLEKLDIVVCSIHSYFDLSRSEQTERVIKAMKNKHFNILGHPSGRLINEREPLQLDMEKIVKAAKDNGCFLEVNSHPDRLDLTDINCKMAKDMGVKVVISTDSHQVNHLDYIRFGVSQARRGWLEKKDVLNTHTLKQLHSMLKKK